MIFCAGLAEMNSLFCAAISITAISMKSSGDVTASMNISYKHTGQEFLFSTSAGYAMAPEQGQEFEDLYHKADVALFSAKMNGKIHLCNIMPK